MYRPQGNKNMDGNYKRTKKRQQEHEKETSFPAVFVSMPDFWQNKAFYASPISTVTVNLSSV